MVPDYEIPLDRSEIKAKVSTRSGCYAAFSDASECLYVGRAQRLLHRVLGHYIDQRDGNGIQWRLGGPSEWYVQCVYATPGCVLKIWESDDYIALERHLVGLLKPSKNKIRYRPASEVNGSLKAALAVALVDGRPADIIGESRDKTGWCIRFHGNSPSTRHTFHKSRCEIINRNIAAEKTGK